MAVWLTSSILQSSPSWGAHKESGANKVGLYYYKRHFPFAIENIQCTDNYLWTQFSCKDGLCNAVTATFGPKSRHLIKWNCSSIIFTCRKICSRKVSLARDIYSIRWLKCDRQILFYPTPIRPLYPCKSSLLSLYVDPFDLFSLWPALLWFLSSVTRTQEDERRWLSANKTVSVINLSPQAISSFNEMR